MAPTASLDFAGLQRFRTKSDDKETKTLVDQHECEQSCGMFFFPLDLLPVDEQLQLQEHGFANDALEPQLMRAKHAEYLSRALSHLPSGFVSLDASRPWIIYWILHALELLDRLPSDDFLSRSVETLGYFWNAQHGGFGGGVMQLGHTATTYASCLTLALVGTDAALETVDRQQLYRFFMSRKHHASGAFSAHEGGEVDVRVTYCVISIASLYGILTDELTSGVVDFVVSCQTYEGGFAGEPFNEAHGGYAFCAVATLWLLDAMDKIRDLDGLVHWITNRQMPFEGGYQGRTNKLVDGCYSFWQGALPALLQEIVDEKWGSSVYQCNREALQRYILLCGQQIEGGLRDKPGKPRDHYHSCYCLSGLSVAQHGLHPSLRRRTTTTTQETTPVVVGDASNLLVATHPAYNIGVDKAARTLAYFRSKGAFVPEA
jgi:protein farnesyltransferase subunit beta